MKFLWTWEVDDPAMSSNRRILTGNIRSVNPQTQELTLEDQNANPLTVQYRTHRLCNVAQDQPVIASVIEIDPWEWFLESIRNRDNI